MSLGSGWSGSRLPWAPPKTGSCGRTPPSPGSPRSTWWLADWVCESGRQGSSGGLLASCCPPTPSPGYLSEAACFKPPPPPSGLVGLLLRFALRFVQVSVVVVRIRESKYQMRACVTTMRSACACGLTPRHSGKAEAETNEEADDDFKNPHENHHQTACALPL